MVSGTVKFFNRVKNFGFIAGDDWTDYFVHVTGLKPDVSIDEGNKVRFDVVEGEKGPKADKVENSRETVEWHSQINGPQGSSFIFYA